MKPRPKEKRITVSLLFLPLDRLSRFNSDAPNKTNFSPEMIRISLSDSLSRDSDICYGAQPSKKQPNQTKHPGLFELHTVVQGNAKEILTFSILASP